MGLFKKKPTVDSADVLLLRAEMAELKGRLDASEQAKTVLEDRLSSIAATTMILSNTAQSNTAEIVEQIEGIQARLDTTEAVGTKVDELHQRVIEVESRHPASEGPFSLDVTTKLTALSGRIEQVAQLAAAPAQPDDELAARLEHLTTSAETVELLQRQLGTLTSRVGAQAEMADQLRALSDRISLLQQRTVDTSDINERIEQIAMAKPLADELGERVVDLTARVAASEQHANDAVAKASELEARLAASEDELRASRDRAAAVERRLADVPSDDLAQQLEAQLSQQLEAQLAQRLEERIAELTHRIDAQDDRTAELVSTAPTPAAMSGQFDELRAEIERRLAEIGTRLDAQATTDERLAAIDERLGALDARDLDVRRIHELLDELRTSTPGNERVDAQLAELERRLVESEALARAATDQATGLADRIGQVDDRVGDLDGRVGHLDGRVGTFDQRAGELDHLRERLDQVAASVPDGGSIDQRFGELFNRMGGTEEAARVARETAASLEQRLAATAELPDQLAALNARVSELRDRGSDVDEINRRIEELAASIPSTDAIHAEIAGLAQRLAGSETDARTAREQAAALEDRLGNISTELANQLSELSHEMDQLATREPVQVPVPVPSAADETAVAALKASQVKLATEQARYEITFREDLAALAEQVRQLRGRS